ncbi:MAG: chaperone modulatory protein CbpM [Frankiales bacterium]|jgi:chaperone modulatory protein CbpM|nr:chaperone modulatory protein CbpM [Frankiales bacterium]
MSDQRAPGPYQLLAVQTSPRLSLDSFAARAGLHPELVRRLVALGLIPATRDGAGQLWFVPADLAIVGRIRRLRADLSLNYAALGLVMDLLDRIRQLENATAPATRRHPPWI